MKRLFPVFVLLSICFAGCDDGTGMIWDYTCRDVVIHVTDKSGRNLANPDFFGSVVNEDIYVMFQGEKFELDLDGPYKTTDHTRALPPSYLGFYLMEDQQGERYLIFGEFSPSYNYRNEPITIHWGDGTSDQILFTFYVKRAGDVRNSISLNGKVVQTEYFDISIVKE